MAEHIWLVESDPGTPEHRIYAAYSSRHIAETTAESLNKEDHGDSWVVSGAFDLNPPPKRPS